jgi:RND family efflux transporter MFP subunit
VKKWIAILLALALAGAGGFLLWKRTSTPKEKTEAPAAAAVERVSLRQVVTATGKVVSNLDVEIKCKASGEIVRLPFDVSQEVRRGDLLLELDPADEERSVKQAEASLASSEARVAQARKSLAVAQLNLAVERRRAATAVASAQTRLDDARAKAQRLRDLLERKLASPEESETAGTQAELARAELETARTRQEELEAREMSLEVNRQEIRAAEAQLERDRIALDLARQRLADTRVRSPLDGVVTARNVQIGQIVSSGISTVGGGTAVMVVSDLSRIFVLVSVDESDIGKVAVGQEAAISVDAFPGKRFPGRVVRIATKGTSVSNVVTFEVKVEVTSPERNLLRPEMTASVETVVAERSAVLAVPLEAVVRKGGKATVTMAGEGDSLQEREVGTGIDDGKRVEILSGLAEGERVRLLNGGGGKWSGSPGARSGTPRPPFFR